MSPTASSGSLAESLEVGRPPRRTHPRARRRMLRGVLAFVGTSLVLIAGALLTSRGYAPPRELQPFVVAPVASVAPSDRHLPYAFVDRVDTVTDSGLPSRVVRPRGAEGTIPGIVLVGGAGPSTRDDLATEAEALARGGLAVLTYDKRTSNYSALHRDYEALADDALAALQTVARQPGVDPDRVGLLGFSEGGWVVPLAAERSPLVAFTILESPSVVSPLEEATWRVDHALSALSRPVRAGAAAVLVMGRRVVDYSDVDVTPALQVARRPTYAVWGSSDETIPVAVAVERLRSADGPDDPVEVVGGGGHRVPIGSGWAERAADWVRRGYPEDSTIRGAEPDTLVGLPRLPQVGPLGDPRLQLALALLAGIVAVSWPVRPTRARGPARD